MPVEEFQSTPLGATAAVQIPRMRGGATGNRMPLLVGLIVLVALALALVLTFLFMGRAGPTASSATPDPALGSVTVSADSDADAPAAAATSESSSEDVPTHTLSEGTWITVVHSLELHRYTAEQAQAQARSYGPQVLVVNSNDYPGDLRAGYWALVIDGWSSEADARAGCAQVGREVGRYCYAKRMDDSLTQ